MSAARARRRLVLDTMGAVSGKIEQLLAGQDVTLATLPLPQEAEPGETPLERLQRFRALLGACLGQLDRGEPLVCGACGAPLPDAEADAMPWATRCRRCT